VNKVISTAALLAVATLTGCAIYPTGPSLMALPGGGASFEQFQADDASCQAYAANASGLSAQQSAQKGAVDSAVVGTVIGAAAGAMIGAAAGDPAAGAAIGGGSGLLLGSASGTDAYRASGYTAQDRYDNAYVQCMYARGHQVPVPASVAAQHNATQYRAPINVPAVAPIVVPPGSNAPPAGAAVPPPGMAPPPGY